MKIKNRNFHKKRYLEKKALIKERNKMKASFLKTYKALSNLDEKILDSFGKHFNEMVQNARKNLSEFSRNINYGIGDYLIKKSSLQ